MNKVSYLSHRAFLVCEILVGLSAFTAPASAWASSAPKVHVAQGGSEGRPTTLSVSGAGSFAWDLNGDGRFDRQGSSVSYTFKDSGSYSVRVMRVGRAVRSTRARPVATSRVVVANQPPTATVGGPYQGQRNRAVTFQGSATDPSPADRAAGFRFMWNFGDGRTASGRNLRNPSHTYSSTGVFTVRLTVRDKDGAVSPPSSTTVTIAAGQSGTPTPSATPIPPPTTNPPTATSTPTATPQPSATSTSTPTATPTATSSPQAGATIAVNPTELSDQIITNPGIGWQSCDQVNSSGHDAQGIPNGNAYIKYYWKDLEPSDGVFNWTVFDQRLQQAHNSGQKVAFRVVVVDNITSAPAWLRDAGAAGTWFQYTGDGAGAPTVWTPNYDDAIFQQRHFQFLQAMGQRYNNHPDIDSVDIGTVGLWGEWHFGETSPTPPMPSTGAMQLIIDRYNQYFPNTPRVAQLENQAALAYAVQHGAGFRGDCLGNMNWQNRVAPPGMYEQRISGAQAQNAWQTGPVNFEACWTIQYWVNQGWDVDYIFNWALSKHMSAFHNKNATLPSSAIPKVNAMLKRIGYRYVLRELRHVQSAHAGNSILLSMDWENVGVAPTYGNYVLGVQIRNAAGTVLSTITTSTQAKNWMPGPFQVDQNITLPSGLSPGQYTIAISIIDPVSHQPKVQLASSGKDSSGWYPLSTITIN